MPKMKSVGQGVQKLEPEQPDTHTHTHTHTHRDRQTNRQTHVTENITFPLSRLLIRIIIIITTRIIIIGLTMTITIYNNNFYWHKINTYIIFIPGLLCDLLWSDPDKDVQGWGENDRGVSFTFGADVVSKFLNRHDLDLICRAHQVIFKKTYFFSYVYLFRDIHK